MLEKLLKRPSAVTRRAAGILGPYVDSFLVAAAELGYTASTMRTQLWVLGDLERWLKRRRLVLLALEEQTLKQFLEHQRRHGRLRRGDSRTVQRFLEHLRAKGVVPSPEPAVGYSPLAALGQCYEDYLRKERALCPGTVARYGGFVRQFLVERFGRGPICLRKLVPDDVSSFVLRGARSGVSGSTKLEVTALRSFCRFLFRTGKTKCDLAGALPTVAAWRLAEVPRYLEPQEVERVLQACDRDTAVGRRDYAVLLLLARLGLRASEVLALELGDIDWRAGVLTVRGKGRYYDQLPLPPDVGKAIATYLRHDRPSCSTRRVFIRNRAPHRGFAHPSSLSTIVCRAVGRAGLQPNHKGAHLLRHSLATGMLRRGASFAEISQILRHRAPNTTEIYAKVDLQGLRALALPWPRKGGER
ncbi:MAG: tyrosine-type recombinase/integrase [Candidatus Anammoximicrobium sp.]|nr:tyrosine-type recombinase/integrase [Candidatus Anammoximicrobium sp.]